MCEILSKQNLVPKIHLLKIAEPILVKKSQPGQFVLIRIMEKEIRINFRIETVKREVCYAYDEFETSGK